MSLWTRRCRAALSVTVMLAFFFLMLAGSARAQQTADQRLDELEAEMEDLKESLCEAPEFKVEWFSSHGAVLVAKAKPNLSFKTIQILPTSVDEGGQTPIFSYDATTDKPFIATEDGARRHIPFNGKEGRKSLNRIRAQNGWVAILYEADDEECSLRRSGEIVQPIMERHKLSIDAGTVLALEEEGGWNSQLEVAVVAESKWWDWLTGYVDLRYSYIGASDDTNGDDDDGDGDDTGDEADDDPMQEEDQVSNPFESGGGSFRGNLSLGVHPFRTPSFALVGGVGFSTAPDSENLRAEIRYFTALRFQVFAYNVQQAPDFFGNTSGFVQFGYAQDDLWEWDEAPVAPATETVHRDESERWFVEAQLKLPSNGNLMSFSPRIYADIPVSGDGPSDVRISILAKLNLQNFVGFFGGGSQ